MDQSVGIRRSLSTPLAAFIISNTPRRLQRRSLSLSTTPRHPLAVRSRRAEVEASVSPTDLIDFQSHPRCAINFRQVAALNRGASGTRNDKSAGSGGEQNNQRFRMKREFYLTAEMRRAALARRCSAANTRTGQISFEIEITFRSFACYNLASPSSCLINVYTVPLLHKLPRRRRDQPRERNKIIIS